MATELALTARQAGPRCRPAAYDLHRELAELRAHAAALSVGLPESWWDFGAFCPVADAMAIAHDCAGCGGRPTVRQDSWNRVRVGCEACDRFTATALHAHVAAADWNRGHFSVDPPWRDCPFFGLESLSEAEAEVQLARRREVLDALATWLKASYQAGNRHGTRYVHRMLAYANWATYAHRQFLRQTGRLRYARQARRAADAERARGVTE